MIPVGLIVIAGAGFALSVLRIEDWIQLSADRSNPKGWGEAGAKGCGWGLVMALQLLVAAAGIGFFIALLPRVRWTIDSDWEMGLLGLGILLMLWVAGGELAAAVHPRDVPADVYIPLDDRLSASGKALMVVGVVVAAVIVLRWMMS